MEITEAPWTLFVVRKDTQIGIMSRCDDSITAVCLLDSVLTFQEEDEEEEEKTGTSENSSDIVIRQVCGGGVHFDRPNY